MAEVGKRLGFVAAFSYRNATEIFAEHAALSAFENDGLRAFNIGAHADISATEYENREPFQWPQSSGQPKSLVMRVCCLDIKGTEVLGHVDDREMNVVARIHADHADIFTGRLGAVSRAARHRHLDLRRGPGAPHELFDLDAKAGGIAPRIASKPGFKAVDLFRAVGEGRIKALWIMATNPVDSMPEANDVRAALQRCPFVVVSDITAETDTAACADVLLP